MLQCYEFVITIYTGTISGSMYIYPQLDQAIRVRVGRKGKHSTPAKCEPDGDSGMLIVL